MRSYLTKAITLLISTSLIISACKKTSNDVRSTTNRSPIANAGPDQLTLFPKDSVFLDGSASTDPDGKITAWLWTKIAGPASSNIINITRPATVVKNLAAGTYQFELRVTDDGGLATKDTVQITVEKPAGNQQPITNAGTSDTVAANCNKASLSGSATDRDGFINTYLWTQLSGPNQVTIVTPNNSSTFFTNFTAGTYRFVLRATDDGGASSSDTTEITVVQDIKEIIFANLLWSYEPDDIPADEPRLAAPSRPDLFCDPSRIKEVAIRSGTEWIIAKKGYGGGMFNYDVYGESDLRVLGWSGRLIGSTATVRVRFW